MAEEYLERVKNIHPLSVIIFLIGVVLGVTGITLAIIFGVKDSNCICSPNAIVDCDAKLFTIRTGVNPETTGIQWSDALKDPASPAFKNASNILSSSLADALQQNAQPSSAARVSVLDAASPSVKYIVSVTKFEQGVNNLVIAYASAAATGGTSVISTLNNVTAMATESLNSTTTVVEPSANVDSMQFCNDPNIDLNSTIPVPPTPCTISASTETYPPITCAPCTSTCPPPEPCNISTCPPPEPCNISTCPSPVTCPPGTTTCPACPSATPSTCPTVTCPTGPTTCPPPVVCSNVTTSEPCTTSSCPACDYPTSSTSPTEPTPCPTDSSSTCPVCQDCPATCPTASCPDPTPCPTSSSSTCPPCPTFVPPSACPTTCPEPATCPTTSSPTCPVCPSSLPPSTCPTVTCPAPSTCPTSTCPDCPTSLPPSTCPTSCPDPTPCPRSTDTTCPTVICPEPSTCPTVTPSSDCPVCQDCPTSVPSPTCPAVTCPTVTPSSDCPVCQDCPTSPPPTTCPPVTCPTSTGGSTASSVTTTGMATTNASTAPPATCPPCQCTSGTTPFHTTNNPGSTITQGTSAPTSQATSTPTPARTTSTAETSAPVITTPSSGTTTTNPSSTPTASTSTSGTTIPSSTITTAPGSSTMSAAITTAGSTTTSSTSASTAPTITSTAGSSSTMKPTTGGSTSGSSTNPPTTTVGTTIGSNTESSATSSAGSTLTATTGTSPTSTLLSTLPSISASTVTRPTSTLAITTTPSSSSASTSGTTSGSTIGSTSSSLISTQAAPTVVSTTVASTSTTMVSTTMEPCPGGTYVYDGDIAIIFEATYLADPTAQTEQNVMMNTFISTQLLMYGKGGRTSGQKGSYDLIDQITRVLPVPYPNPGSYPLGTSGSFRNGPRSVDAFNATLVVVDTILGPPENEARIADGIQYTIQATDRGNYSAAIIVAISDAFVTQAQALAKQLQGMHYQVFTIALNSEKDFSSLATDANSAFTLPNPRSSADAQQVSQAIGDFLVTKSYQCIGVTSPPTESTTKSTATISTTVPTTTNPCLQEYLNRNIVYLFEDTNNITFSNMSANFIPILANKANRDLLGSGTIDPYSQMMAMPYPNPDNVCGGLCQFGPVNPDNVAYYTQAFMIYGQTQPADPDGLNQGVIYAQVLMENLNNNGNTQTIVFFANSAQGVADAQKNVNDFKKKGVALAAVSVGGNYALLASLTSPNFKVHVLEDGIDQNALADEIVTELMTLGTTCVKTTTPTTPTPGTGNTDGTAPTTTSARTTTTLPSCKEKYINRDVIYMFESTVSGPGASTSSAASILSATFLNTLIRQAQSDLMGSGKASSYSFFSLFSYPDEDQACSIINCHFGQIPLDGVPSNTETLLIISQTFETLPSDDGIDGSLTYSQSLPLADDSQKNGEIIVLFANSESGVAKATANAKQLNDNNVAIITVSVGGNYDLSPLSYPDFAVHYLDATTNSTQLAQEIIAEMVTLGTACVT